MPGKFPQKQKDVYQIVVDAINAATDAIKPGVTYQSIHLLAAKVVASGLKDLGIMQGDVDEAVNNSAHAMFFPHGLGHMMGLDVHDMENYGEDYVGYDEETKRIQHFGTAYLRLGRKLQEGFVRLSVSGRKKTSLKNSSTTARWKSTSDLAASGLRTIFWSLMATGLSENESRSPLTK